MRYEILKQSNVLYVEDDLEISRVISLYLKSFCKTLHHSINGADGLEYYKENSENVDIVITDINMPQLSGTGMIKAIRKIDIDVPIVITSAFSDEFMLKEVINLGVDGFITKPFSLPDLYAKINKVLIPVFYKKELQQKDTLIFQQAKLAAMGEMIGNIAHQWRQPLNSIGVLMMKLELNMDNENLSKDVVLNAVDGTNTIIGYMSKTIDDFRDFFIPNKDKEIFVLKDIFGSLSNLMKPQLNALNIDFKIIGNQNIELFGYSNELQQVLINIIGNAKDALKQNNVKNGTIIVDVSLHNEIVSIKISDNAGGVESNILSKIFDPYFTTKFKSQGTGLGLYISKVIIEKNMEGKLSAVNTLVDDKVVGVAFTIDIKTNYKGDVK